MKPDRAATSVEQRRRLIWVIAAADSAANLLVQQLGEDRMPNSRFRVPLNPVTFGRQVVVTTTRPFGRAMGAAINAGTTLERRALDRVLDSEEIDRIVVTTLDSERLQAAVRRALDSEGAQRLVDSLFDSGLIDHLLQRLGESDALWRLIDEIAQSPAVLAAVSQQGLGFADQVGDEMRTRSRRADDWLERAARRLVHREQNALPPADPDATSDEPATEVS
jgi:hypothetical protein